MWKVARSTDDALASTKFTADLGALKPVRCVALANHNLSANASVLVKVMGESGNPNLLTYSEDFVNAAWAKGTNNVFAGMTTDPNGGASAYGIKSNGTAGNLYLLQGKTAASSSAHTYSAWIMCPNVSILGSSKSVISVQRNRSSVITNFNLPQSAAALTSGVWKRVSITVSDVITGDQLSCYLGFDFVDAGNTTTTLYIWGAQLEVGSTPTTYKPTTTTASNIALHYSSGWKPAWRMTFDNLVEWESATWWTGTAGDEYLRSPYAVTAIADDTYSARYITVEINDTANADGYVQIGRLFVGGALQPTYNPQYGLQDGLKDLSTVDAAESGAMWGNEKRRLRYTSFVLPYTTPTEAAYLHEMQRSLGTIGEVLYIPYPADPGESQRWGYIGRMSELSPIDYPYYRVRSIALKLEEIA